MLITAASSSVALEAIQITKSVGALAIAATRGAGKKPFLLGAGAYHVIVTEEEDLAEKVMAITSGKGVSLVVKEKHHGEDACRTAQILKKRGKHPETSPALFDFFRTIYPV